MAGITPDINELLQQYFDKVLVLTVPRFKERQEKVKERLAGINFEFFYGVDKNDLDAEAIALNYTYDKKNSLAIRQYFPPLNTGEIACSLSHRDIYNAIIDNNWKKVLVFEDDVVPDRANLPLLFTALKELPADWELFYLGYLKNEKPTAGSQLKQSWYKVMSRLGLARMPLKMIKNRLPKKFSSSLMKAGFHDCTHAYAVNLEGAKKLVKAQTPVIYRADNLLTSLVLKGELNAFTSKSFLFNQEIFTDKADQSFIRQNPPGK
ncbi:MAG: glycosyltransferase family 25 protein [Chitinophagaceae bacterium]